MHRPFFVMALCLFLPSAAHAETPPGERQAKLDRVALALALTGARHQAAHVEAIAWWNWELRRALKEYLFLSYVRGTAATQACFPLDHAGRRIPLCPKAPGDERYDFAFVDPRENTSESGGPFLPSACLTFEPTNNYCQKNGAPGIHDVVGSAWTLADPISAAAKAPRIIEKKIADCAGRTEVGRDFLFAWLLNVDRSEAPRQTEDPFAGATDFSSLGYLVRVAAIRARIDAHVKETEGTRTEALLAEARDALRREGLKLTEMTMKETTRPLVLQELSGQAHVSTENFETKGILDRGDCFHFRQVRAVAAFPFGLAVAEAGLPSYQVSISGRVLGSPLSSAAEAKVEEASIGPSGDLKKLFLASAKAVPGGKAEFDFPNPLVSASDSDPQAGGFTRASHLGYLNGAGRALDSWRASLRLAGAISPWEASRYLGGCRPAAKPVLPARPVLDPGDRKAIAAFRERIGAMLGASAGTSAYLGKVLPDEKIERLFARLRVNNWLTLEKIPEPYLQGEKELQAYARRFGAAFTASAESKSGNCAPRVSAKNLAAASGAPEPPPAPVPPPR